MTKKYLVISSLIIVTAIMILPRLGLAQTTAEQIQAQINALMQQVAQLQSQLAQIQGGTTQWCHTFNTNLSIGDGNTSEARFLRAALGMAGFPPSINNTDAFDESVASAVTGFQQKYKDEILTPLGLQYGTGYVGSATRAKLNKLYGCGITPTSNTCGGIQGIICPAGYECIYSGGSKFTPYPDATGTCTPIPTKSSITVLSPNGGESWQIGKTQTIRWTTAGNISTNASVNIYFVANYQCPSSTTCMPAPLSITQGAPNTGSFNWTVGNYSGGTTGAGQYRITISDFTDNISDTSDAPFSIVATSQAPTVSYISPTSTTVGSTVYVYGSNFDQYTFVGLDGTYGTAIQPSAITLISPTSLSFVVPSSLSIGTHTLAVAEKAGPWPLSNSVSLNIVTAINPSITVLSPNGGETWQIGTTRTITWSSSNVGNISIWLCQGTGSSKTCTRLPNIPATGIRNTGSYSWIIGFSNTTGSNFTIRVASEDNYPVSSVHDDSDAPFSIVGFGVLEQVTCVFKNSASEQKCYVVASFLGDTNIYGRSCSGIQNCSINLAGIDGDIITWASSCGGYAYTDMDSIDQSIEFNCPVTSLSITTNSLPSGTAGVAYTASVSATGGSASYFWSATGLPAGLNIDGTCDNISAGGTCSYANARIFGTPTVAGTYTVNITVTSGSQSVSKQFSLVISEAIPRYLSITMLSPNGGELWYQGGTYLITWSSQNVSSNAQIVIGYGTGGQDTQTIITSSALNTGSYSWTISQTVKQSNLYKIYLHVLDNTSAYDSSDAPFSIVAATP